MNIIEDHRIIELYWERSEVAISETAKKFSQYCHSISFNILHNYEDAEECVNDTYFRAWGAMPPKRPNCLATFLGKITRNLSLDKYYSRKSTKTEAYYVCSAEFVSFDRPHMYITQIIPSPDKKLFAVTFCSNKSVYLMIWDLENGFISPELIDSARIMVAKELDYTYWQRIDYENYSGMSNVEWIDNDSIEFHAFLPYEEAEIMKQAVVCYDFPQKHMECTIIEE